MMKLPDVRYYKTDLTGLSSDNKVTREYHERVASEKDLVFVLKQGHFFQNSLQLFKPDGTKLVKDVDYEFYGLSTSLTKLVKDNPIGLFIKLLDPTISQWYATYQVVGNFSIVNRDLVDYIETAINDDRPVNINDIRDFPKWLPPKLHQHDLRYEIHSFKDIIDQIKRINQVYTVLPDREKVSIDHFYSTINFYIDEFKNRLSSYIAQHDSEDTEPYTNDHGLTSEQMELGNVDNFETATLIQLLEGIRSDLHITADLAHQVVEQYAKESDQLFHKGILPIIRYGNNNFIPPSIDGSFEGMGGSNFNTGMNQELDGTYLILTPRNDGRVAGLYFLRNSTLDANINNWEYTAYRYVHPKATADGINLTSIINGSNGKFMIVGNGSTWYWTYGNGTLDPAKHQLNQIPAWTRDGNTPKLDTTYTNIITVNNDKVYVMTAITGTTAWNDAAWRQVAFKANGWNGEGPADARNVQAIGYLIWELDVKTSVWRRCKFNYSYCGDDQPIQSDLYVPFVYELQYGVPRADRDDYSTAWSLTSAYFKFTYGINDWNVRWYNFPLSKYDAIGNRLALKYFTASVGTDSRNSTFESNGNSFTFSLENPVTSGDFTTFDVVKGMGLQDMVELNTLNAGTRAPDSYNCDELPGVGWSGSRSFGMIAKGVLYSYGTGGYGTFPARTYRLDFRNASVWEDYDQFLNNKIKTSSGVNGITRTSIGYNEKNPVNLSIGMHSEFYMFPNVSNPEQYGCFALIDYPGISTSLVYRRMDAMDSNLNAKAPSSTITAYNNATECYPLSNVVKIANIDFYLTFVTVCLLPTSQFKELYYKSALAHSTYKTGRGSVNNNNANHLFNETLSFSYGDVMQPTFGVARDFQKIVEEVLLPSLEAYAATLPNDVSVANAKALYTISKTYLEDSNQSTNGYVFTSLGFDADGNGKLCSVMFNVTNIEYTSVGLETPQSCTIVGNWVSVTASRADSRYVENYRKAGTSFNFQRSMSNTSPRNIVIQQQDGSVVIAMYLSYCFSIRSNVYRPGATIRVTMDGITDMTEGSNYWTAGEFRYFPHPYYGLGVRAQPVGAASIGRPVINDSTNNYDNIARRLTQSKYFLGMNNYIQGAFTVYFKSSENVTVGGNEYTLPSGYIDLFDIDSSPYNKTFYCYLAYGVSGVGYKITIATLPDTFSQALLATIVTNANGIYTIRTQNVFTMNGFRISAERHGSSIPAATGPIIEVGQTSGWADNQNDLS